MSEVKSIELDAEPSWPSAFGQRLQSAREQAGMSQEAVQEKLGFPTRSITRWENGKSEPGFAKVAAMAKLYGFSTDWIAGHSDIKQSLSSGQVIIDGEALAVIEKLEKRSAGIYDVPDGLMFQPGLRVATAIPTQVMVVGSEAAQRLDARMRALWQRLGGAK